MLNKTPINWIQQHIKNFRHHDQIHYILGMQRWFKICTSLNIMEDISRIRDKNLMNTSVDAESAIDKIQHSFIVKAFCCCCCLFVIVHLFTSAYIVWVISPPFPTPLLSFRQVLFCPCDWFCWRKDISIIRKTKRFC
jgi:hypothetical protein